MPTLELKDAETARPGYRAADPSARPGIPLHLNERDRNIHWMGSLPHNIGKLGFSDSILTKPGLLTSEERNPAKQHAAPGAERLPPVGFYRLTTTVFHTGYFMMSVPWIAEPEKMTGAPSILKR